MDDGIQSEVAGNKALVASIDMEYVNDLLHVIDGAEFDALVETLKLDVDLQLRELESLVAAAQPVSIPGLTHRLAGLLSQFGALDLVTLSEKVSEAKEAGDVLALASHMIELSRVSMTAIAGLNKSHDVLAARRAG